MCVLLVWGKLWLGPHCLLLLGPRCVMLAWQCVRRALLMSPLQGCLRARRTGRTAGPRRSPLSSTHCRCHHRCALRSTRCRWHHRCPRCTVAVHTAARRDARLAPHRGSGCAGGRQGSRRLLLRLLLEASANLPLATGGTGGSGEAAPGQRGLLTCSIMLRP
jgi:hypothetical protein